MKTGGGSGATTGFGTNSGFMDNLKSGTPAPSNGMATHWGQSTPTATAMADTAAPASSSQGVYVPGHGYVGSAQNVQQTIQGYDQGQFWQGDDWSQEYDPMKGEYWKDGSGAIYDKDTTYAGGDSSPQYAFKRRNDALNTYQNSMGRADGWNYDAHNNFQMDSAQDHPDWVNQASGRIKTGEKEGTRIQWNLNPETNTWDPRLMGVEGMDTNEANRTRNLALGAFLTAGIGGVALGGASLAGAGGMTAAEAAAAGGTMGVVEGGSAALGGMTAAEAAAGLGTGIAGAGSTAGSAMTQAELMNLAYGGVGDVAGGTSAVSGMPGGIGSFGGGAGMPGGVVAGEAGGGIGGLSNMGGMGSSTWMDNIRQGYDYYNQANRARNMINPQQQNQQRQPGFFENIFNIGGGLYSADQNRDYFHNLQDMYSRREQDRQPFLDRLRESYENPNAYLESPEYKAIAGIEENKLTRGAARTGRLANSTDRDVLMQAHAQKGLGDYRKGLNSDLQALDVAKYNNIFQEAQNAQRMANMPIWAAGGYGAGGGGGNPYGQAAQWAWDNVSWDDVSSWGDTVAGWFA